jgi:hypothetical protein
MTSAALIQSIDTMTDFMNANMVASVVRHQRVLASHRHHKRRPADHFGGPFSVHICVGYYQGHARVLAITPREKFMKIINGRLGLSVVF